MSSGPLVSVVIPTYNRPEMLARAIRSVDNQSYRNIELIVVDGPSETPAQEVINNVSPSVEYRCLTSRELHGLPVARNRGIEVAEGEYIAFLDDDDEWREEKIQKQISRFEQGNFGAVYCGVEQIAADGTINAVKNKSKEGDILPSLFSRNFIGTLSCIVIRKEVIENIGGFDEDMPVWEDWDMYIRIAQSYDFGAVMEPLVKRNQHGKQTSRDIESREQVSTRLFEKHRHLTSGYQDWTEEKFKAGIEFYLAESAFTNDMFSKARGYLLGSIHNDPYRPKYYFYLVLFSGGKYTFYPAQIIKRKLVDGLA